MVEGHRGRRSEEVVRLGLKGGGRRGGGSAEVLRGGGRGGRVVEGEKRRWKEWWRSEAGVMEQGGARKGIYHRRVPRVKVKRLETRLTPE